MRVVYLDIDSLRADHVGAFGYGRPTTPRIDGLAREGTRFTQCFASDSPCMPSRAALMTGRFGIDNGIVTHGGRALTIRGQGATLPLILREHGIAAVAVSTFGRHPAPWFGVGWQTVIDPVDRPELSFQQVSGEAVGDAACRWLEEHRDLDTFYLHVHFWDPHGFYEAPLPFVEAVRQGDYPAHPTPEEVERHQADRFWRSAPGMGIATYADWQRLVDEYDGEVRYVDHQVGRIVDLLETIATDGQLMVIVSADHGEELGEHRLYMEHWSTHDGTQRVPLVVRDWRQGGAAGVFDGLVAQLDVSATVLDALGVAPPPTWEGRPLLAQAQGRIPAREHLVVGHGLYTSQRAVLTRAWKWIRTYHPGMWDIPREQLYRRDDPWEEVNLADEEPDTAARMDRILRQWEESHREGLDPMAVNTAEGPFGLVYAGPWTERFRVDGIPTPFVLARRKPMPRSGRGRF